MTRSALAKALRRRQLRLNPQFAATINASTDDDILRDYYKCAHCRALLFQDTAAAIANAPTAEAFLQLCNLALVAHHCPVNN